MSMFSTPLRSVAVDEGQPTQLPPILSFTRPASRSKPLQQRKRRARG